MNYYEFVMYDKNSCLWNFEDEEKNVIIKANSESEATTKLLLMVSSEYESEAILYYARKINNISEYAENHYFTIWNEEE